MTLPQCKSKPIARRTQAQRRDQTMQKLRLAALYEFASYGVVGASIDRLSQAAGLTRGAFYSNYKSKDEILLDILHEQFIREYLEWRNLVDAEENIDTVFASIALHLSRYIGKAPWSMLYAEVELYAKRNSAFEKVYRKYLDELNGSFSQLIRSLFRKAGRAPCGDLDAIAMSLRSLFIGLSLHVDSKDGPVTRQEFVSMVILFLSGVIYQGAPLDVA